MRWVVSYSMFRKFRGWKWTVTVNGESPFVGTSVSGFARREAVAALAARECQRNLAEACLAIDKANAKAHTGGMIFSDATEVRVLRNGFVAVSDAPMKPAKLLNPADADVFVCSWAVYKPLSEICPPSCECEGAHGEIWAEVRGEMVGDCGAAAVRFENGWVCAAGHRHVDYTWGR